MSGSNLVVISGPIGSGKSTVAERLAAQVRAGGDTAAVIDLDRIYMMLDDRPPMTDLHVSGEARRAAAALTNHFVLHGVDLVIVEGDFWTREARETFAHQLSTPVDPLWVTLCVTVEEALKRVASDSGRRTSRLPDVLRASHAAFAATPAIAGDLIIDSTRLTVEQVAHTVLSALDSRQPSSTTGGLFRDVDCIQIPVPDLAAGIDFYCNILGHALVWRTELAAGLQLDGSPTELVIQTDRPELEANLFVLSADDAAARFVKGGGAVLAPPFDIAIGRCAVLRDPWGNRLVVLDHSKGRLLTDPSRNVRPAPDGTLQTEAGDRPAQ